MTKAKRKALAAFFHHCYTEAVRLDDPKLKNVEDIPRALMGIRGAAKVGYYDVTGKWLLADGTEAP